MLLLAALSIAIVVPPFTCTNKTSTTLSVVWKASLEDAADVYYAALFPDSTSMKPYAIVTSDTNTAKLEDLFPNTTYFVRLRAHPRSAPSIVAGWTNFSQVIACKTAEHSLNEPRSLSRVGEASTTSINVKWEPPSSNDCGLYTLEGWTNDQHRGPPEVSVQSITHTSHLVQDLKPGTSYFLRIRCEGHLAAAAAAAAAAAGGGGDGGGGSSFSEGGLIRFNTLPEGTEYLTVYRVSEYGADYVDFLANHNAGDLLGEAGFLGDSGNFASKGKCYALGLGQLSTFISWVGALR
jgi:hypothetical protein